MMAIDTDLVCNKVGCTLAQTGFCVLDHDPESCQERLNSLKFEDTVKELIQPIQPPTDTQARFSSSYTLNIEQAENLMMQRYCRLIGVLGAPGTGKTACLVSFYLMLAHGRFSGFEFRDSKTIMAFEEICQGARTWNEAGLPDTLTLHTELPDERTPGFLHLRLSKDAIGDSLDLLIPDLPGEWTDALIDSKRTDRLNFLKSAETIWLMVNGQEIQKSTSRHMAIHRLTLVIQRLAEFLEDYKPPIVLVVTHKDLFKGAEPLLKKVLTCASTYNFPIKVQEIASFSDVDGVKPGEGISDLLNKLVESMNIEMQDLLTGFDATGSKRQFMNFGK